MPSTPPSAHAYAIGFGLVAGLGMLAMWTMSFVAGDVPETQSAPTALAFHLAGEALTALSLVAAALGLWRRAAWGPSLYLVALGAFGYTAIVSPGYFAQRGEWGLVVMFALFVVAAVPAMLGALAAGTGRRER